MTFSSQSHCKIYVLYVLHCLLVIKYSTTSFARHLQGVVDFWPEDIVIRRNLTMSAWMDGPALVMRREASLLDDSGSGIPAAEFLSYLADLDESPDSFAFSWAATAGEDGRMKLQLQSLPASTVFITTKPLLKG